MNRDIAGSLPEDASKKKPIRDNYRKLLCDGPLGEDAVSSSELPIEEVNTLWERTQKLADGYATCLIMIELLGTDPWNVAAGRFRRKLEIDPEIRRLTLRELVQHTSTKLNVDIVDEAESYVSEGAKAVLGSKRWKGPLIGAGVGASSSVA